VFPYFFSFFLFFSSLSPLVPKQGRPGLSSAPLLLSSFHFLFFFFPLRMLLKSSFSDSGSHVLARCFLPFSFFFFFFFLLPPLFLPPLPFPLKYFDCDYLFSFPLFPLFPPAVSTSREQFKGRNLGRFFPFFPFPPFFFFFFFSFSFLLSLCVLFRETLISVSCFLSLPPPSFPPLSPLFSVSLKKWKSLIPDFMTLGQSVSRDLFFLLLPFPFFSFFFFCSPPLIAALSPLFLQRMRKR